jgi:ABC-type phosphate/phosphonate transport system ATPase subunit
MLRIDNLEISLKNKLLLTADYLNLNAGEKAVIIGNNDSGKSLLLRSIHGDYVDFKGSIFIKEKTNIFYKNRKQTILIDNFNRTLENETLWKNLILPLPGVSTRTRQKIIQFCQNTNLSDKLEMKARDVSNSSLKMIEVIRAVIQLPHIILIDDFDMFFDKIKMMQALEVLDYATNNGSCLLVTTKQRIEVFDFSYRIQNNKLVKL